MPFMSTSFVATTTTPRPHQKAISFGKTERRTTRRYTHRRFISGWPAWWLPYDYAGAEHAYEPDFIVRVRGGGSVVVEIKGLKGELHDPNMVTAKNEASKKWVAAVNNARKYGRWGFEICRNLAELESLLEKHATPLAAPLPFKRVEPNDADKF